MKWTGKIDPALSEEYYEIESEEDKEHKLEAIYTQSQGMFSVLLDGVCLISRKLKLRPDAILFQDEVVMKDLTRDLYGGFSPWPEGALNVISH